MTIMVRPGGEGRRQPPVAEVKPDSWGNKPPDIPPEDVVTLPRSQLQAILDAIDQVNALNINDKLQPSGHELVCKNGATICSDTRAVANVQGNGRHIASKDETTEMQCPLQVKVPPIIAKHWASPQSESSAEKLSPLSKVEQKRMQWEKEKAEMRDWNPWGKPGAGAPSRRSQLIAPVAPRAEPQLLMVQTTSSMPYANSVPSSLPSSFPSPSLCQHRSSMETNSRDLSPNKVYANYNYITQPVRPVPPALKSSLPFAASDDAATEEDFKKRRWLQELDYQRDEQHTYQQLDQEQIRVPGIPDAAWVNGNKDDTESILMSMDAFGIPAGSDIQQGGRTYARGQGFKLDPVSAARAEERRLKAQEYQKAIKIQMEEKQRRLLAEKERKKREEEEEERRLETERARLQEEYEQEQRRLKQKTELEERKQKAVLTAVQEAQAQAEAEKKARKVHKLSPLTDESKDAADNSVLSSTLSRASIAVDEVVISPKDDRTSTKIGKTEEVIKAPQQMATVRPIQSNDVPQRDATDISDNNMISSRNLGTQTAQVPPSGLSVHSNYTVNRVLTPSILRMRIRGGKAKDFGTQTDKNYGKWIADDAESTESNTSSINSCMGEKLNRVQYSKPYKASRHVVGTDLDLPSTRPKWGANQPSKSYIRMTERDPHFSKRKKMQELRKQHWEREMAAQQAISNARRSVVSSYPNCRSRPGFSSSDGTAGFSSSDVDSRPFNRVYSNSTHYRNGMGHRSTHGSADDIIYLGQSSSAYPNSCSTSLFRRRDSQSSDNLPSIIGGSEPTPSRLYDRLSFPETASCSGSLPPMRRKWHSQENFRPHGSLPARSRQLSPPVPAIQKRAVAMDIYSDHPPIQARRKWSDQESFDLENVALSRVSGSQQGSSDESSEKNDVDSCSSAGSRKPSQTQPMHDPLVHPEVVTGRPTPRQDRILQQLSSLRHGLLQKQKELEKLIRRPPQYMS